MMRCVLLPSCHASDPGGQVKSIGYEMCMNSVPSCFRLWRPRQVIGDEMCINYALSCFRPWRPSQVIDDEMCIMPLCHVSEPGGQVKSIGGEMCINSGLSCFRSWRPGQVIGNQMCMNYVLSCFKSWWPSQVVGNQMCINYVLSCFRSWWQSLRWRLSPALTSSSRPRGWSRTVSGISATSLLAPQWILCVLSLPPIPLEQG